MATYRTYPGQQEDLEEQRAMLSRANRAMAVLEDALHRSVANEVKEATYADSKTEG